MRVRKNLRPLLRRQFAGSRGASVLLVVIILVTCTLLAAWPRAVGSMFTQDVQQTMRNAPTTLRSLVAVEQKAPPIGPAGQSPVDHGLKPDEAQTWGAMEQEMSRLQQSLDQPLRSVLSEGHYTVGFQGTEVFLPDSVPRIRKMFLGLNFDPHLADHITMVDGRPPVPLTEDIIQFGRDGVQSGQLEIMMSRPNAKESRWELGKVRDVQASASDQTVEAKLVGIFEPKNADAEFWKLNRSNLHPEVSTSAGGDNLTVGAEAFAAPAGYEYATPMTVGVETLMWFPLNTAALSSGNVVPVNQQLTAFTGSVQKFAPAATSGSGFNPPIENVRFTSDSPQYLQDSITRAGATNQILAMMAAGPLGVCLAALALVCRMMLDRRRPTLMLAAARGASRGQLHGSMALEGLFLGLPAAAAGVIAAVLVFPGEVTATTWGLPLLLGLVPSLLLGFSPVHGSLRGNRQDLNPKARGRIRLAVEGTVLTLAAVSVTMLFQRGLGVPDDGGSGPAAGAGGATSAGGTAGAGTTAGADASVDLLLAGTPLLLALAACVLVLRLYPLPLRTLARVQERKTSLVGFLGSVRSLRAPGGGLVPVLSIVVGLAVVVFSAVLLQTMRTGVEDAAKQEIAADIRITGQAFDPGQREEFSQVEGIETSVGVATRSGAGLTLEGAEDGATVRMVVADVEKLAAVQADVPGSVPADMLAQVSKPSGSAVPVILSEALQSNTGDTGKLELLRDFDVTVAGAATGDMNLTVSDEWALVDEAVLSEVAGYEVEPDVILASLSPGADSAAVVEELESLGPQIDASSVASRTAQLTDTPLAGGLQAGLLTVMVFIGGLCALIVIMTSVISAPARNKLLGLLRTLGFARRHDPALLLWEIGPMAAAGVVAGVVLGLLLPRLVVAGVDLRTFTGGGEQPPITYDPLLLTALIGGFILIVLLAVAAAIAAGRRQRLSSVLRIGEEV